MAMTGWWEWKAPSYAQHICLTEHDLQTLKHDIREQLRLQCFTQLIAR